MFGNFKLIAFLGFTLFLSQTGYCANYFTGETTIENAEIKEDPSDRAITLKILPKGTVFNAAEKPVHGYYAVRTATKKGWLKFDAIKRNDGQPLPQLQRTKSPSIKEQSSRQQNAGVPEITPAETVPVPEGAVKIQMNSSTGSAQ